MSVRQTQERYPYLSFGNLSHLAQNNLKENTQITSTMGMADNFQQESWQEPFTSAPSHSNIHERLVFQPLQVGREPDLDLLKTQGGWDRQVKT